MQGLDHLLRSCTKVLHDEERWEQVQTRLAERRNGDTHIRAPKRSLLAGMIVDGEGRKMTPSHTSKGGKRYRYYVTHPSTMTEAGSIAWRISATEVERIVIERLVQWLSNRSAIINLVGSAAAASALAKARHAATELGQPGRQLQLVGQLITKVEVTQEGIVLSLDGAGVEQLLGGCVLDHQHPLRLTSRTLQIRQGKDVCMIVKDEGDRSTGTINQPLVSLIAEAHELHRQLTAEPQHSIATLADSVGKCPRRSAKLIRIALLAPEIIASCIAGTQPASMTTKLLLNVDLPVSWQSQRALLGFA